jgi:GTP-binding protein Era
MSGDFRCGHVAVVGRTNAGKSTLVNRLVGEKISIVSPTPQTTRTIVVGVRNEPGAQLVLVDTPGFHKPQHELNRRMMREAEGALEGVDAIVVLVDAADNPGRGDDFVLQRVRDAGPPFIIALNKVDRMSRKGELLPLIEKYWELGPAAVIPISSQTGLGVDDLVAECVKLLPESPAIYPADITTDQTERFLVAELIREKILLATREEIPHATTVLIESMEDKRRPEGKDVLVVEARLVTEKENQKAILIGKGGTMLKRIGTAARQEIEELLGVRCHLSLLVGLHPKWREDEGMLEEMFAGSRALVTEPDLPSEDE